eukprot:751960-Hanusia_phi.AAC.4
MGMINTPSLQLELQHWEKDRESTKPEVKVVGRLNKPRRLSPKSSSSQSTSSRQWFSHSFDEGCCLAVQFSLLRELVGRKYGMKSEGEEGRQSPSTLSSLMQPVLWKASWRYAVPVLKDLPYAYSCS